MNPEGTVYNAQGRINRLSVLCIDAYGVAVKNGFKGTVEEWLASLKGEKGDPGKDGTLKFEELSPEEKALLKGDPFTYEDFTAEQLAALKGDKGDAFTYDDLTPEQIESLKGEDGVSPTFMVMRNYYGNSTEIASTDLIVHMEGKEVAKVNIKNGTNGKTPIRGTDYWTPADQTAIVNEVLSALPTWTGGSY